jgi:hypothetical protein
MSAEDWQISIFVPDEHADEANDYGGDAVRTDSLGLRRPSGGEVIKTSAAALQESWNSTIAMLTQLGDDAQAKQGGFTVDSIEVGLTLTAKGGLAFIAEAGAQASVKLTLKRR